MKNKQIKAKFREEFGIHFKGSSGELKFAESFIEEALASQRTDIIKEVSEELEKMTRHSFDTNEIRRNRLYNQALQDIKEFLKKLQGDK